MAGQPQVIIGAQIKDGGSVSHTDMRILRRADDPLALVSPRGANVVELASNMLAEGIIHVKTPKSKSEWLRK